MLKEICITPHVFDHENIDSQNWIYINFLLQQLSISGFILGINNKDWKKSVFDKIGGLDPKVKDSLLTTLSILNDRDRIVGHPKDTAFPGTKEDDWFNIAQQLNNIRNFYRMMATKSYGGKAVTASQLTVNIPQEYGNPGSVRILKTVDNLRLLLLPFLSYAKIARIIDPYFHLHKQQCIKTLNIVAECFRERRGRKESGRIWIHCEWDEVKIEYNVEKWKKIIDEVSKAYGHLIMVRAWERKDKSRNQTIKLHDRYIITNQGGLVSAAGTDTDAWQQSEWSIKPYETIHEVLSQYEKNSSPFILKCEVTASSVEYY